METPLEPEVKQAETSFPCSRCDATFKRESTFKQHWSDMHGGENKEQGEEQHHEEDEQEEEQQEDEHEEETPPEGISLEEEDFVEKPLPVVTPKLVVPASGTKKSARWMDHSQGESQCRECGAGFGKDFSALLIHERRCRVVNGKGKRMPVRVGCSRTAS